jgi:hypothetical protein
MDKCYKLLNINLNLPKNKINDKTNKLFDLFILEENLSCYQSTANIFDYLMINIPTKKPNDNHLNSIYFFIITLKLFTSRKKINLTKSELEKDDVFITDFQKILLNEISEDSTNYSFLLKIIFSFYLNRYFLSNLKSFKKKSPNLISYLNKIHSKQFNLFNVYLADYYNNKVSTKPNEKGINKLKFIYFNLTIDYYYEQIGNFNSTSLAYVEFLTNFKQIYKFIFENLCFICSSSQESNYIDSKEEKEKVFKKLLEILYSIKNYKFNLHHSQTCPKQKHNSFTCKQYARQKFKSSIQIHHSITCISVADTNDSLAGQCLFKKINFKLLAELMKQSVNHENKVILFNLLYNFGLCTCIDLESLLDIMDLNGIKIEDLDFLNNIFTDYLIHLSGLNNENNQLCLDTDDPSSLKKHLQYSALYLKCEEILLKFNEKSYLLMNMLKNTIYKLDKYTFINQFNLMIIIIKLNESCLKRFNSIAEENASNIGTFKAICIYFNQFLSRFNFYFTNVPSNHLNFNFNYFIEIFVQNSLNIYSQIEKLCVKYEIDCTKFIEPLSICSNLLIIHEYMNFKFKTSQNNQLVLTKSLVSSISCIFPTLSDQQHKIFDFDLDFYQSSIQILLNSYWKCKIFRLYLNGFTNFDSELINCANDYLKSTEKKDISFSFLEILFDFILTYYYFNLKVG